MANTRHGPVGSALRTVVEEVDYRVRLGLLAVLGPAQLDEEHDPIEQLRRRHRRRREALRGG